MSIETFDDLRDALATLTIGERIPNVTITPELAGDILNKVNVRNRRLTEVRGNVQKLSRVLRSGHWNPVPTGLMCFYHKDKTLADGQCRLSAVFDTGVPIVVHIELVEHILGMDEGRARGFHQQLHMDGVPKSKDIAAVAKALHKATDTAEGTPGTTELVAYYHAHRAFITECVIKADAWLTPVLMSKRVFKTDELAIVRAVAIRQEPPWAADKVDQFLEDAVSGAGAYELASLLYRELGEAMTPKPKKRKTDMTMAALDNHLRARSVKRLSNLKNPKKKPVPVASQDETA